MEMRCSGIKPLSPKYSSVGLKLIDFLLVSFLAIPVAMCSRLKEGLRPLVARLKTRKSQLNNLEVEVQVDSILQVTTKCWWSPNVVTW